MALFLSESDVRELLTVEEAIPVVERAFHDHGQGRAVNHPRGRIRVPQGFMHLMSAALIRNGVMGFKAYATVAGGSRFVVQLFDMETGEITAIIEADRLGQIRTGAASAVAARYLAREDAETLGIIGTGYQAETQLEAVCCVREIQQAKAYSRTAEPREQFAERMSRRLEVPIQPVDRASKAVQGADVIVTITTAREPVLKGAWLPNGSSVLAAGGNHFSRRELDAEAVGRADRVVVDDPRQARRESGDVIAAVERGVVRWEEVFGLRDVLAGRILGRRSLEAITLFESQGIALEDVAVADSLVRQARAHGLGREVEFSA